MKANHLLLVIVVAASLTGCASSVSARYSYDSDIDYSNINSYAWMSVAPQSFSTPESTEHFFKTMNNMLAGKGFKLNAENPDFLVGTQRVKTYVEEYVTIYGNVKIPEAMIRIVFIDAVSKEVIYESAADAYYDENWTQTEKNTLIEQAVETLGAKFPPERN